MDKVNHWLKGRHKRCSMTVVVVTKKHKEQYMLKQSFSLLNVTAHAVSYQTARELFNCQWPSVQ